MRVVLSAGAAELMKTVRQAGPLYHCVPRSHMGPRSKGIDCVWIGLGLGRAWGLVAPRRQLENSPRKRPCGDTAELWDRPWLQGPR